MKTVLLVLLPLLFSGEPQKPETVSAGAAKNLWGEWVKLRGDLHCEALVFYPNGLLNINNASTKFSTAYELTVENAVPMQGRIIMDRLSNDSPETPFTVRFLSPEEIEITLRYKHKEDVKAAFKKLRSIRPGAKLIR